MFRYHNSGGGAGNSVIFCGMLEHWTANQMFESRLYIKHRSLRRWRHSLTPHFSLRKHCAQHSLLLAPMVSLQWTYLFHGHFPPFENLIQFLLHLLSLFLLHQSYPQGHDVVVELLVLLIKNFQSCRSILIYFLHVLPSNLYFFPYLNILLNSLHWSNKVLRALVSLYVVVFVSCLTTFVSISITWILTLVSVRYNALLESESLLYF